MKFTPLDYQDKAITWLKDNPQSALFMGMGLGKTASTLKAFADLRKAGQVKTMLVVAPLRVALLTWKNEVEKWDDFHGLKVICLRGPKDFKALEQGKGDIYTINYEGLLKLATLINNNPMIKMFDVVVYDELTRAKNPQSKRIKTWRQVTDKFNFRRWGLTGTPQPNGALELYGQIALLDKGARLGKNFFAYRNRYFEGDYMGWTFTPRTGAIDQITKLLSTIALVLKSEDYLDVPEVFTEDIMVDLPAKVREQYKEIKRELFLAVDDSRIPVVNRAVLAGKLLQLTGGHLYDDDKKTLQIHTTKLEAMKKLLDSMGSEPVLIVASYKHEMESIKKLLGEDAVMFGDEKPEEVCDKWNAGKIKRLIAHPASIGHGLNLQERGKTILWYSLNWSRELYDQTNARLVRKGQKESVTIYRILAEDTIDEAIVEVLRERGDSQNALMETIKNLRNL